MDSQFFCENYDEKYSYSIINIANETKPIQIECGSEHVIVLFSNGNVYGWGNNKYNQINESKTKEYPTPIKLDYHKIESIACGEFHTCLYQKGYVTYFGRINDVRIPPTTTKGYCHGSTFDDQLIIYDKENIKISTSVYHGIEEKTYY